MINLLEGITRKLDSLYPDIPIYLGNQNQITATESEVNTPCFFIFLNHSELLRHPIHRFYLSNLISINYLSSEEDSMFDLERIRLELMLGMEQISLYNSENNKTIGLTGDNLETRIRNRDISFSAYYNIWIEEVVDKILMESLDLDMGVKPTKTKIEIEKEKLEKLDVNDRKKLEEDIKAKLEEDYMRKLNKDIGGLKNG